MHGNSKTKKYPHPCCPCENKDRRERALAMCMKESEYSKILITFSLFLTLLVLNTSATPYVHWKVGKFDKSISRPIPILMDISNNPLPSLSHYGSSERCSLCKFNQSNSFNNSSPRDFIFGFSFGKTKNLLPFIRSLRTTGSKASACVFVDDKAFKTITRATYQAANDCGLQIYNIGDFGILRKPEVMTLPYYLSYFIIKKNYHMIDRLIILDLFDSAFQADPFTTYLNESYLHFSPEFQKLKNSFINRIWITEAGKIGYVPDEWKEEETICAAYLGGTVDLMFRFLYEYITCEGIVEGWRKDNIDQGVFNYLLISGRLADVGIPAKSYDVDDTVLHFSLGLPDYPLDEFPYVRHPRSKLYPVPIVHHYYRSRHFIKTLKEKCPIENPEWTNYASGYKYFC